MGLALQDKKIDNGIRMSFTSRDSPLYSVDCLNPLNFIQNIFVENQWEYQRNADDELYAEVEGRWALYHFSFLWRDDFQALSLSCSFQLDLLKCDRESFYEVAARINECLWMGHFNVDCEGLSFSYRYTLPIRSGALDSVEQICEMIDTAFWECDRFYPVFSFVASGEKSPIEAIVSAMIEVQGEA